MFDSSSSSNSKTSSTKSKELAPKVRWMIQSQLEYMTFVGRDVVAVAHDLYIDFINLKTSTEVVYTMNSEKAGDGIDCIAGHRSHIFSFAEKVRSTPRIFIISYPTFEILAELKDPSVNRYKGLCMMENELVCAYSGIPDYTMSVWSWRTGQRLISVPMRYVGRNQIYVASRTHMLVCQCWGEGLVVWEVAACYKKCLVMRRLKQEQTGWEVSEPRLEGVCWSTDGQLYAVDKNGDLLSMCSDGVGIVSSMEWTASLPRQDQPYICALGTGILIYGPDRNLRMLKKIDSKWQVTSTFELCERVESLISNATCDVAVMWTCSGIVYKVTDEDALLVTPCTYKQRLISKIQLIAPTFDHVACIDNCGVLTIYELSSGKLVERKKVRGQDISFEASPTEPILVAFGEVGQNYGLVILTFHSRSGLTETSKMCLTHQIVSRVIFSDDGRYIEAAAMSAGHVFIFTFSKRYKLELVRYAELGRGLADCLLMTVGDVMRSFNLILVSDKYTIGERVMCINAETGKDNKFAGKMQGPYSRLLPYGVKDTMIGIPHLSKQMHILKLYGEKGITVQVKMGGIVESGHDLKLYNGLFSASALLTWGCDGAVILRSPDDVNETHLKIAVSHRYEKGMQQAFTDPKRQILVTLSVSQALVVQDLSVDTSLVQDHPQLTAPDLDNWDDEINIIRENDKNYLDVQEDKKVYEETLDFQKQRDEVVRTFRHIRSKLVQLLEENLREPPLHQLSLAEFNLHQEAKRERLKQAERERENIRVQTEARILGQNQVTAWIKQKCWDSMQSPRVKLFALFSHYQVENYAVLPTQRQHWPELLQVENIRNIEVELDEELFRPWEEHSLDVDEPPPPPTAASTVQNIPLISMQSLKSSTQSRSELSQLMSTMSQGSSEDEARNAELVLSGSNAHKYIHTSPALVPQTLAYSFLHMNWATHVAKLHIQNMRLWFNKQFDELMTLKKREVGLVSERNTRLRFIIDELNKLSDLRGSFHHLKTEIRDPVWMQEEQPERLIKVDPEECEIPPYISPSQIVLVPPDPGPKDDFRERALVEMMDGVLEKLWHEEIKKPIPMPQVMLDKEPENFNEDDLRLVFDYEAKVQFRNEERDRYRKMLHAEYAKLSAVLNEGITKFNQKVKDTWLQKLQVDSVVGQEALILMRLRRTNLDRLEMDEKLDVMRAQISKIESEIEVISKELQMIQEQGDECQASYDNLTQKDKAMERTFKQHFADLSPIIVDQCFKYYKKRPKWHQRATMIPVVLYELANAILSGVRPPLLHPDCVDFYRCVEQLDQLSNMPPVMDEGLWVLMCKLRRAKIDNEIRMRAIVQEMAYVDSASTIWTKALACRRSVLTKTHEQMAQHRETVELTARNKTIQLVLPAGQVEVQTTGHMEDFEDAALIPCEDIETINNLILKVGAMKLKMMRKQMEFRRGILAKEWQHAQVKMKLKHMKQELYSYERLRIPKELQQYLKNKEKGYTEEVDYLRMEKEMEATKMSINRILSDLIHQTEEIQLKIGALEAQTLAVDGLIAKLNVKVSEKRLEADPFKPIRMRRLYKKRMDTLVGRSRLIRHVQANHSKIVLLQTELELLRLKTYPTLASFRTLT